MIPPKPGVVGSNGPSSGGVPPSPSSASFDYNTNGRPGSTGPNPSLKSGMSRSSSAATLKMRQTSETSMSSTINPMTSYFDPAACPPNVSEKAKHAMKKRDQERKERFEAMYPEYAGDKDEVDLGNLSAYGRAKLTAWHKFWESEEKRAMEIMSRVKFL